MQIHIRSQSFQCPSYIWQWVSLLCENCLSRTKSTNFSSSGTCWGRGGLNNCLSPIFSTKKEPSYKTTGQRLKKTLHAFHRLYQSQFFGGLFKIGSRKTLMFSGFDQNAQIKLLTCKFRELMAESQYPQTTRSLLKTGLLLFVILLLFLFSR